MFIVNNHKCLLKGLGTVEPGKFKNSEGVEVPYDGYNQVVIMTMNKNGKLQDIKCRIPNSTEGNELFKKLGDVKLGSEIIIDVELQVSTQNTVKPFITKFTTVSK